MHIKQNRLFDLYSITHYWPSGLKQPNNAYEKEIQIAAGIKYVRHYFFV